MAVSLSDNDKILLMELLDWAVTNANITCLDLKLSEANALVQQSVTQLVRDGACLLGKEIEEYSSGAGSATDVTIPGLIAVKYADGSTGADDISKALSIIRSRLYRLLGIEKDASATEKITLYPESVLSEF